MTATNGLLQTFPARNMPPPVQKDLHPAAKQAAAAWSDMMHTIEALQVENGQLKADLAVERRHIVDLQRLLDAKAAECHRAQRYAIEVRTHLKHVIKGADALTSIALEADACALAFSREEPEPTPSREDGALHAVEKAIAGVVTEDGDTDLSPGPTP